MRVDMELEALFSAHGLLDGRLALVIQEVAKDHKLCGHEALAQTSNLKCQVGGCGANLRQGGVALRVDLILLATNLVDVLGLKR